jgi:protein-serine/threonine kinase
MLRLSGTRGASCHSPVDDGLIDPASERRVELERRLQGDAHTSEERKQRQLQQLGKKESTFLRLRRTKLGLNDFRTVKVIGRGAFGEVDRLCHATRTNFV